MKTQNTFYVAKLNEKARIYSGFSWASGEYESVDNKKICSTSEISVKGFSRFVVENIYAGLTSGKVHFINDESIVIKTVAMPGNKAEIVIPDNSSAAAIELTFSSDKSGIMYVYYTSMKEVVPHYKNIKKKYKKESGQMFFRESIDGKISLHWNDYTFVRDASLEDTLGFFVYQNGSKYASNRFNKSDCSFDHAKASVELKLTPNDKYTKILNGYERTYDLLKLPVEKTAIQLIKRAVVQIYIQGDNTITSYAGGTHWEDEVLEPIDNQEALLNKYFFSKGPKFAEVSLQDFNWDINGVYACLEGQSIWNGFKGSLVFTKVYSAGTTGVTALCLSDGTSAAYSTGDYNNENTNDDYDTKLKYDAYRIEIYSGKNGTGTKLYQSKYLYGNDSNFVITNGTGLYSMEKINLGSPYLNQQPESFFLGENVIEYQIWGRLLCDADKDTDGLELHDLPFDDFATERANYKKCTGLNFSGEGIPVVRFKQSATVQASPTQYGINDFGEYFVAPTIGGYTNTYLYPYPLARSTWGNTSLWVAFEENSDASFGLEKFLQKHYKTITQKDFMEVGSIIKALLKKIDSSITFDSTSLYSEFLYGSTSDSLGYYGDKIYITQKSNILKGEYDQAAQKAEITFKQLMDMLRDCFKCYWYIDSNSRFRIEHIRYFMQGRSYTSIGIQLNLTEKNDKFNKLPTSFCQQQVSFNKSDLKSRYEFAWSDDTTLAMGGGFTVDVISEYVEQDAIENVNVDLFTTDIDYMLFAPNKFLQDGFTFIVTNTKSSPITYKEIFDPYLAMPMKLFVQNYRASFLYLFNNYMYDMPARTISTNIDQYENDSDYNVQSIKRSMEHRVEFSSSTDPDLYLLIKTNIGEGNIEDVSIDIDTKLIEVLLSYEPK